MRIRSYLYMLLDNSLVALAVAIVMSGGLHLVTFATMWLTVSLNLLALPLIWFVPAFFIPVWAVYIVLLQWFGAIALSLALEKQDKNGEE